MGDGGAPARGDMPGGSRPRFVVVVAPKGGVGKTTLSMALLVSAKTDGCSVLGVNMDAQTTLETWAGRRRRTIRERTREVIPEVTVSHLDPHDWRQLQGLSGMDLVVVDTPPGHGDSLHAIRSVCGMADIVLVPTSPSGVDLEEVIPFGRSVAGGRAVFVLNKVNRRTRSGIYARDELNRAGELCPIDIPYMDTIQNMYGSGLTVTDGTRPGHEAFAGLWTFVRRRVGLMEAPHG